MEHYLCSICGQSYAVEPKRWRCDCGSFLDLEFEPKFHIDKILKRSPSLWRYREAIPVKRDGNILTLGEGLTPLQEMSVDGHPVLVKIDYLFPTGSYKDRGAAVLVSKARELGVRKVVEDSSGNAGAAIAAYCASAGMSCEIYVPRTTSPGKLVQIQTYGATVKRIEGSREKTAEAAMKAAAGHFYASHCWNPYFLHGTKTFAFEVWEQLGWKVPETLVLPVGHGSLFLGAYLGFKELREAGLSKKIPKFVGVQAARCAPLFKAFQKGMKDPCPLRGRETLAEGIAIATPVRGRQILEAIRETGGEVITVTESEIKISLKEVAREGHFVEPTSAATFAGLKKYLKYIKKGDVVTTLTGSGLKAIEKINPSS
jgi:threonine synthase